MTKYLFFLIILLIPSSLAFAEEGSSYIRQQNPDGTFTISLLPYERIFVDSQWVNYNFFEDIDSVSFESASSGFKLDKTTCDFALYEKGRMVKAPVIENYKMEYLKDDVKVLGACNISTIIENPSTISFNTTLNGVTRIFTLGTDGVEWTSVYDNVEGKDINFKIHEICEGCTPDRVIGDELFFGEYKLDLKNEQHGTLTAVTSDKGNYIMEYETIVKDKEQIKIDPTFSSNNPSQDGHMQDAVDDGDCTDGSVKNTADTVLYPHSYAAASANDCINGFVQWDTTAIPDDSTITDVKFKFEISFISTPDNCDYMPMTVDVTTATDNDIMVDIMNGTPYSNANTVCTTTGNDKVVDLGSAGNTDLQAGLINNRFALGIKLDVEPTAGGGADQSSRHASEEDAGAVPKPTLEVTYVQGDGVTDLTAIDVRSTSVDLDWSTPSLSGGVTIVGYQINSTTPWSSNVASVSDNDTGSTTTSATVSGLTGSTQYSFRVGAWFSSGGTNANGNVLNITTDVDPTVSFTPGTFNLTGSGTDVRTIKYDRIDIDATTLLLNITADNDFELACNFHYKFAAINRTYTGIANTSINANEDMASFRFNNVTNEIIDVLCWDQYTNQSARYLITITDFPLLDQIRDFRNGTFGTQGNFGALDFITVIVVVVSLVGFNRVNEFVGLVFGLFIIGGLAVLSAGTIIAWETTYTAIFAVLIMFGIAIIRRD